MTTETVFPITTEDGRQLDQGAQAFDYYNMKPGRIGEARSGGWFIFEHDGGGHDLLNGQRICSTEYAAQRGWINA